MMIDQTMNSVLDHVGVTMSKEDVISEYVTRYLEDHEFLCYEMDHEVLCYYEMALTSMYNKLATYTKQQVKEELEDQNIGGTRSGMYDDLIEATQLWDLSTEEEG